MSIDHVTGRDQRINRIGLVLIVILVAVFALARTHPPPLNSVDGTYANPCCAPIRLTDGVLISGDVRVPFKLSRMKFGLVAYPARTVRIGPGNLILTRLESDPGSILFDKDHRGFTLLDGNPTTMISGDVSGW